MQPRRMQGWDCREVKIHQTARLSRGKRGAERRARAADGLRASCVSLKMLRMVSGPKPQSFASSCGVKGVSTAAIWATPVLVPGAASVQKAPAGLLTTEVDAGAFGFAVGFTARPAE